MMVVVTGLCASMLYAQGGVPKDSAIAVRDHEKLTGPHDVYKGKVDMGRLNLVFDQNSRVIMQDAEGAIDETAVYESEELAVGDWVKVIDGPFNKFLGIVKKVEKDKVITYIYIFSRLIPLELDRSSVQRSHGPGYKELTEKYYRWFGGVNFAKTSCGLIRMDGGKETLSQFCDEDFNKYTVPVASIDECERLCDEKKSGSTNVCLGYSVFNMGGRKCSLFKDFILVDKSEKKKAADTKIFVDKDLFIENEKNKDFKKRVFGPDTELLATIGYHKSHAEYFKSINSPFGKVVKIDQQVVNIEKVTDPESGNQSYFLTCGDPDKNVDGKKFAACKKWIKDHEKYLGKDKRIENNSAPPESNYIKKACANCLDTYYYDKIILSDGLYDYLKSKSK